MVFLTNGAGQFAIHTKLDSFPLPYTKSNSKYIKKLEC